MSGKLFNKENVKKFADSLYYEKDGKITYKYFCTGYLARKDPDEKEMVGCILADLYEEFEGKPIARLLSEEESATVKSITETDEFCDDSDDELELKYNLEYDNNDHQYIEIEDFEDYEYKPCIDGNIARRISDGGYIITENMIINILAKRATLKNNHPYIESYFRINLSKLPEINDSINHDMSRARELQFELNKIADEYLI